MSDKQTRIGIMMPTWVGDACMATPALRGIRRAFPADIITAISRPVICDLLSGLESGSAGKVFDSYVQFDKRSSLNRLRLASQLRQERFDSIILLTNSLWSAGVARLAGIRRRIGYDRDARGWLLSDRVPVPRGSAGATPISPIDYYLGLAGWIGGETSDRTMHLGVSDEDAQAADQLWSQLGWAAQEPCLVINNNAATEQNRTWPANRVLDLAKAIVERWNWNVLLHCGPGERDVADAIALRAQDPRIASMGVVPELPIGLSKAVLEKCTAVVSSDSGPRHIAVACNRPVIGLFGATDPAWTETFNVPELAIQASDQTAAGTSASLKQPGRMQDITVDKVMLALVDVVENRRCAA